MNNKTAKQLGFTHKGFMYGFIRIYAMYYENCEQPEIVAKNRVYEILLDVFTWLDMQFGNNEGFYMELKPIDEPEGIHLFSLGVKFFFLILIGLLIFKCS